MRKNSRYTDLKWNSKKNLSSSKKKMEALAAKWADVDFFIVGQIEDVIAKIEEIEEDINGIDPRKF
ncbi:MAG: hypothetical protein COB36_11040 [Alphaproteobacteria bacterium]|nr:MAG: hypothetical protein COB36_11040 [Alphaproteobacteria bacterium]